MIIKANLLYKKRPWEIKVCAVVDGPWIYKKRGRRLKINGIEMALLVNGIFYRANSSSINNPEFAQEIIDMASGNDYSFINDTKYQIAWSIHNPDKNAGLLKRFPIDILEVIC